MNKADKIFITSIILCALLLYVPLFWIQNNNVNSKKEVVVYVKNKEVLRVDLLTDKNYVVDGTLGEVDIEVKDGKVRVEKETSPYHLCSIQGWSDSSVKPIICLPNDVWVKLENVNDEELDAVVQ